MNGALNLARKYAQAFIGVYGDTLTYDDINALALCANQLSKVSKNAVLLSLSTVPVTAKIGAIAQLCKTLKDKKYFLHLVELLVHDRRIFLLPAVIEKIGILYREKKNIMMVAITSSSSLSQEDRAILEQFLTKKTGAMILSSYSVDSNLIAGIRIQSEQYLWEYSIDKHVRSLNVSLMR